MGKVFQRIRVAGAAFALALAATSCTTILTETAKKALEDRTTEDQVTDAKIGASIASSFAQKDKSLLLAISVDVWEQRVMLTGTLDDPNAKDEVARLVRSDRRIRTLYDETQIVSKAEQAHRQEASQSRDASKKEGIGQGVNDFWIESKINAKLVATRGVTSVNYRWRSVRNIVYVIGRARSEDELKTVLEVIRATDGVSQVKPFVEIKRVSKS